MENIKDWCISRQLWWGHQIPAYFLPQGGYVVAMSKEEAFEKAKKQVDYPLTIDELKQDEDVLDTWFSSWLWPISVFDGINQPDNKDISYYYPTSDLVTGPDIIFFWVARMIMSGYAYRQEPCFRNVYFTGIVRDKLGRKMSKQLGNSPDPIELMISTVPTAYAWVCCSLPQQEMTCSSMKRSASRGVISTTRYGMLSA